MDLAFQILHQQQGTDRSWTHFNKDYTQIEPPATKCGFLLIIQEPAHEYDTWNTALQRCIYISKTMGQKSTVVTVDQALYHKIMELKWAKSECYEKVIP